MNSSPPAAPAVRDMLDRILASETFSRSERARSLLSYIVTRAEAGEAWIRTYTWDRPTLEVYPLQNYGAIELGEHTFCNRVETPVCKDETNGIGRFFMLWQKQGDVYRLTRVISYDHLSDRERRAVAPSAR